MDKLGWTNVGVVHSCPESPRGPRQIFAPNTSCAKLMRLPYLQIAKHEHISMGQLVDPFEFNRFAFSSEQSQMVVNVLCD